SGCRRLRPRSEDVAKMDHRRVCCRVGIASGIGLLWHPWQGMPKAYRILAAMPALPQLQSAPGGTGTRLFLYNEKRTNVYKYIGRTDTEWKVRQSACLASNGAIAREGFGSTHCS